MRLKPIRFQKEMIERVQSFQCGPLPFQTPLADWIKTKSLEALKNGAKIWLYETDEAQPVLVGYGTLSKSKWTLANANGSFEEVKVASIPTLAIHQDFHGKPEGCLRKEDRYAYQVVRHLQYEAGEMVRRSPIIKPLLTLYVHTENGKAEKLYQNCGFTPFDLTLRDPATGGVGKSMIFRIPMA